MKVFNRFYFLTIVLVALIGCARQPSINIKKHSFNSEPKRIIWLQVAGFQEEHLAMLRFGTSNSEAYSSIESGQCIGKAWNYNLFRLRPTASEGFLAQLSGKRNIDGKCEDFDHEPIWQRFSSAGYRTGLLEVGGIEEESLSQSIGCDRTDYLKNVYFLKMKPKGQQSSTAFHYQDRKPLTQTGFYHDKSCESGPCFSSLSNNAINFFTRFSKDANRYLYIIRDFKYRDHLENKNITAARDQLRELNKVHEYFSRLVERDPEMLVLVTSSAGRNFEFPSQGREWTEYEKSGKFIAFRNTSLQSPVVSIGAKAENFCGIYNESDILSRLLWLPAKRNWNPFK